MMFFSRFFRKHKAASPIYFFCAMHHDDRLEHYFNGLISPRLSPDQDSFIEEVKMAIASAMTPRRSSGSIIVLSLSRLQ
jgi:hypothetical protein